MSGSGDTPSPPPSLPSNVHPFRPSSPSIHLRGLALSPDQSVISTLEALLAAARRGEIIGLAGVVEYPGQWRVIATGMVQRDCGPYIGWLEILQQEMVNAHMARNAGGGGDGDGDGSGSTPTPNGENG